MTTNISPLAGANLLDLSQGVAGPGAAMLCARWGASVIKIEPIAGDWIRFLGTRDGEVSASTIPYNAGKRSLAVDLKSADGVAVVMELAGKADAVLESFRPGVITRLGIGYEAVRAINPDVVYASVSGFGQSGPYVGVPCSDTVAQAFSGMMSVNRGMDGIPHKIDTTIIDAITSLYSFQALSMHLVNKLAGGGGARLDLSLAGASAAIQSPKIIEWAMADGKPGALNAPAGSYRTSDGWIAVTLVKEAQFTTLVDVIGLPHLKDDARYKTFQSRSENLVALRAEMDPVFVSNTSTHWLKLLSDNSMLSSRINDYGAWLEDEQVKSQEFAPITNVAPGIDVPLAPVPGAPEDADQTIPLVGQHSVEILQEAGMSQQRIDALLDQGVIKQAAS